MQNEVPTIPIQYRWQLITRRYLGNKVTKDPNFILYDMGADDQATLADAVDVALDLKEIVKEIDGVKHEPFAIFCFDPETGVVSSGASYETLKAMMNDLAEQRANKSKE